MPAPNKAQKLAEHIRRLGAKTPVTSKNTPRSEIALLFWGTSVDKSYLPYLKGCVGSYTTFVRIDPILTVHQVKQVCEEKEVTRVFSSSIELLKKLTHWDKKKAPSLDDYLGSYFKIPGTSEDKPDIEIIFILPLKRLVTQSYGRAITTRMITKLTKPEAWFIPTEFSWTMLTPSNNEEMLKYFSSCFVISIDIETFKTNAVIRCLSYTGVKYNPNTPSGMESKTVVLALEDMSALAMMRQWNLLAPPKIFQNGKYDISYLARYNAPVQNYLYDTQHLFHCWECEMPKNLGFLNSYFIREAQYWKDLGETGDLETYYKYNALDTWGTANCFLAMIVSAPDYAITNYLLEFPLIFPCHLAEMTGIHRDPEALQKALTDQEKIVSEKSKQLDTILGVQGFNVNSPKQVRSLLDILGCSDIKKGDETSLERARFRHPLNARILDLVSEVRKARKLISTYLTPGKEFSKLDGSGNTILYALNPHGTDSGRLASKEHHFWCGLQIQNIPRGPIVKSTLKAYPGFVFAEADLEQAESRDTAYISGDSKLIYAVEESPDFHSHNASSFFGIPFEEIYDVLKKTVLNKPVRQLSKNVNHGANYNMGANMLVLTMGEKNIFNAGRLLGLSSFWNAVRIAEHLLEQFHKTYPGLRGSYYPSIVQEVLATGKLTSQAVHYLDDPTKWEEAYKAAGGAWTRVCHSDPSKSKQALNSYISHPPQSLNAQTLNKAWLAVFNQIAMHPDHKDNFKLIAQVHDSILFQYREGHSYLADKVVDLMEVPVTVKAYDGVTRSFIVPAEVKHGTEEKRSIYWSEM